MEYVYDYDAKIRNQVHEERVERLSRIYANSRADAVAFRTMFAKSATFIGDLLIRSGQSLMSGESRQQDQQLQPLRVRSEGSN